MSPFIPSKVLDTLPSTLEANAVYAVRTGIGFDLYVVDSTGSVAHPLNAPSSSGYEWLAGDDDLGSASSVAFDGIFDGSIYDHYKITGEMRPFTDNVSWRFRLRDGGADLKPSEDHYIVLQYSQLATGVSSTSAVNYTGTGHWPVPAVGSGWVGPGDRTYQGIRQLEMTLRPHQTQPQFRAEFEWGTSADFFMCQASGWPLHNTVTADGVRFDFSAGIIAGGRINIWGIRK